MSEYVDPFERDSSAAEDEEMALADETIREPDSSDPAEQELAPGQVIPSEPPTGDGPRAEQEGQEATGDVPPSPPSGLVRGRDLLPADYDEDEGDFEPGGLYKGFRILAPYLWPDEPRHAHWPSRFYVTTDRDTPGLVPWPGSQIVWPWESGWSVDLHRPQVETLLKPDEEKKGRKR